MQLDITNPSEPEPCPNCGTVTTYHYAFQPGNASSEYTVCDQCVGPEINSENDGLYGHSEWVTDACELSDTELITVIETEFIRSGGPLRFGRPHPNRLFQEHSHRDQVKRLVTENRLAIREDAVGVDEVAGVLPVKDRREELRDLYDITAP